MRNREVQGEENEGKAKEEKRRKEKRRKEKRSQEGRRKERLSVAAREKHHGQVIPVRALHHARRAPKFAKISLPGPAGCR